MRVTIVGLMFVLAMTLPFAGVAQQEQDPVYEPGNGVTLPKATKVVHAQYTPEAMQKRIEGEVILRCVVSKAGVPTRIEVTRSLDEELDAEAIKALDQWRFEPGKRDGAPVAVRVAVEMHFTLK